MLKPSTWRGNVLAVTRRGIRTVDSSPDRANPGRVIAFGVTLLFASCSARVAATLLAWSLHAPASGATGSRFDVGAALARVPEQFTCALRIAASHAALFVVLLVFARNFANSGNTRSVICAYLCVGIAALAPLWIIARLLWTRLAGDENASRVERARAARTRASRFALVHAGSLLASLLMLAIAASLLVQAPALAK